MSDNNSDLISVIIPTRNRKERVTAAIRSVQAQTWKNIEIIVVDDASSDGSSDSIANIASLDERVRVITNDTASGGAAARNKGIVEARGLFVSFLDDDDLWHENKLTEQHRFYHSNHGLIAVSCDFEIILNNRCRKIKLARNLDKQGLLRANRLGGASMCFARRASILAVGGFNSRLPSCQDWDLWLKLACRGRIGICPQSLVTYLPHEGVRITGNRNAEYRGRRLIHLQYCSMMTRDTRRFSLSQLIYYRKVYLGSSWAARIHGLKQAAQIAGGIEALRFIWRTLKLMRSF